MWTDQCVNAFKTEVNLFLWKKKGTLDEIIQQLSIESGIPEDLLQVWWNGDYQNMKPASGRTKERVKCRLCKTAVAETHPSTKTTYASQLCTGCRKKAAKSKQMDKDASSSNGRIASCPRCKHAFYVKKEDKNDSKT